MHKKGGYLEQIHPPVFPEKNFMTRNSPLRENEEIKGGKHSLVQERFNSFLHTVFPCFQAKATDYREGDFSLESPSFVSVQSPLSTEAGPTKAVVFTIAELSKATSNFSDSCKIGQGGFGTVYKGRIRDGNIVAIKRAKKDTFEAQFQSQFHSEVNMLASVEHLNLVRLIGYVEDRNERILVEEYVANGNLRQHLDGELNVALDLHQRLDIAIDVAHALTYLHLYADHPIIHRDVKASNILLTETFRAKVADFGFSRVGPESNATHVVTKVKGTAGYLDPEYLKTYQLTLKSDVYAFGILLVELLTGRRPIEQSRNIDERITVRWAYKYFGEGRIINILDPKLQSTDATCAVAEKIFELAFGCSAPTKQNRPTMKQVSEALWSIRKEFSSRSYE